MSFSNKLFVEPECDWEQGSTDGTRNPADDGPTGFSIRDCSDSSSCGPSGMSPGISDASEILPVSESLSSFFSKPFSGGFSISSNSKLINCISSSSSSSSSELSSSKSSSMNGFLTSTCLNRSRSSDLVKDVLKGEIRKVIH